MSIRLTSAAWDLDIPSTEKMVLMCLCDFASDDGGNCWPSIATIARKCSKSERTVQAAIRSLEELGFLVTQERKGTSNTFQLDPRKICTPANLAPPQKTSNTPAKSAPKPLRTTNTKTQCVRVMPEGWQPQPFTAGSKCAQIMALWPPGERETQIEHFTAHHNAKGNKFKDWQDAWKTWVLNSRKWAPKVVPYSRAPVNDAENSFLAHRLRRER